MVTRMRLHITLYLHCLYFYFSVGCHVVRELLPKPHSQSLISCDYLVKAEIFFLALLLNGNKEF